MKNNTNLTFHCPNCGESTIAEILINLKNKALIVNVDEDGHCDCKLADPRSGEVKQYECSQCGYIITDAEGKKITEITALTKWLNKGVVSKSMKFRITTEQSKSIDPIWLTVIENIRTGLKFEIPFGRDRQAQEQADCLRVQLELVLNG